MDSILMKTVFILFFVFFTSYGQRLGMPIMEQPIQSNIREPRILGLPFLGSNDLGMSRMPPDIPQIPRPPLSNSGLAGMSTNFGLSKSFRPKTGVLPINQLDNPFSRLISQRPGRAQQRLTSTTDDFTKPMNGPIRSIGPLKPVQTPSYLSVRSNNVFPTRNLTLQQRLLNFLLTRLEQQKRYNQQHQQRDGGFPSMDTLMMMKAMNPEFAEGGVIKNMICMRCRRQQNYFCLMMFCMGEA